MIQHFPLRAALCASLAFCVAERSHAQAFTEVFDDITTLSGNGWVMQNNSNPVGSTSWFQGTNIAGGGPFDSYDGAANAYIGANFNNTTGGSGIISNWLMTPNRTFRNGDVITFYTRKPTIGSAATDYADRLEVRLSTNGPSTETGNPGSGVGDFSTLLLSVNPTLVSGVYPQVWTQYTITISGLPAPTSGRIGFRYFVTGAGPLGVNSDYIGIDRVVYTPYVCPTINLTTAGLNGGVAGTAYTASLAQTGSLGAPSYALTAGALPPGITIATNGSISGTPTATGTFNFTVTVTDASGCSGSRPYAISVVCGPNIASIASIPELCANAGAYLLTEGTPAGGTYSGDGVADGSFDPGAGSATITYDLVDPYGCAHSTTATITVNSAPEVTVTPLSVCASVTEFELVDAVPAGGTWSGIGVTDGSFDPAVGHQDLTYTVVDTNGCVGSGVAPMVVYELPEVSFPKWSALCANSGLFELTGAMPAGGSWTGTGVVDGSFDPTEGSQELTYTVVDANQCEAAATVELSVNAAPEVTVEELPMVCLNHASLTLSGAMPAGGEWSGTGVEDGSFDPAEAGVGTHTLTYSYTDANGCTAEASTTVEVDLCAGVEAFERHTVRLFPNPAVDHFFLEADGPLQYVRVFDATGAEVPARIADRYSDRVRVELGAVPAGMYLVQALVGQQQLTVRLAKQ